MDEPDNLYISHSLLM